MSLLFTGCSRNNGSGGSLYLSKPKDTNLEFWITQRVTTKDMLDKGCTILPGYMGGVEYLDSRYTADTSSGIPTAPETHVTYLVTGYPDTLDKSAITQIEITDPIITVYGLTLNSTDQEITQKAARIANSITYESVDDEHKITFTIKQCSFSFMSDKILISVPVTNNSGVEY